MTLKKQSIKTLTAFYLAKLGRVKVKAFPVHAIKAYSRIKGIAPLIVNFGTRWR